MLGGVFRLGRHDRLRKCAKLTGRREVGRDRLGRHTRLREHEMSERRQNQRYALQLSVELKLQGQTIACSSADLSIGGLRLELPEPLRVAVGDTVNVSFRLPALDGAVAAPAVVRWVDRVDDRMCGLQFTAGLRAREVWAINRLFDTAV